MLCNVNTSTQTITEVVSLAQESVVPSGATSRPVRTSISNVRFLVAASSSATITTA